MRQDNLAFVRVISYFLDGQPPICRILNCRVILDEVKLTIDQISSAPLTFSPSRML